MTLKERIMASRPKPKGDKIPNGHKRSAQLMAEWGMGKSQTQELIRIGIENGVLGMARHKVTSSAGHLIVAPHYYEVKK